MEFPAALARLQLKKIDDNIERRYENVRRLNRGLKRLEDKLMLPTLDKRLSYMAYPVIIFQPGIRNKVLLELESRGVECRPLFGCIPTQQPAFGHLKHLYENKLPVAEYHGANGFFVGCHQYLTNDDVDYMSKVISETVERFSNVER
jgi:CDP-6-deoxy-D-xylo-4-hexulose-3-dehydrase